MRTPVYVPLADFDICDAQIEHDQIISVKRVIKLCALATILCPIAMVVCMVIGLPPKVQLHSIYWFMGIGAAAGGGIGSVIVGASKFADFMRGQSNRNWRRVKRALGTTAHHCFFGDENRQWRKYADPVGEVDHWCKVNEVPAEVAIYHDPMVGIYALYISFTETDADKRDEQMLLFKMKYLEHF